MYIQEWLYDKAVASRPGKRKMLLKYRQQIKAYSAFTTLSLPSKLSSEGLFSAYDPS